MAYAFVQGRATDAGGSSVALAYASNVVANNLLIAVTVTDTGATPALSDGHNTWSWVDTKVNAAHSGLRTGYCVNTFSGALTVTLSGTSAGYGLAIAEFSGGATSSPLDGALHGVISPPNGTNAAPTGTAFTPSANDLAIGAYGDFGQVETLAASTGWTQAAVSDTSNGYSASLIYRILTSSISVTAGWSGSADVLANEVVGWAAFLVAGGATDPFPAGYGDTRQRRNLTTWRY